jgi:uncharacterized membrane protein HdeD (DUF308 family)
MAKFFSAIKKYSIIIFFISALLGVLLIMYPDYMLAYSALFVGISFILCGLFGIISYIIKKDSMFALILGIISAISGVIICLAYKQIMTVMVFLLGIILLVGGVTDLVTSAYVAISRRRSWILTVLLSVLQSRSALWRFQIRLILRIINSGYRRRSDCLCNR